MENNIFKKQISVYNGATDNKGVITSLGVFLRADNHRDEILRLRTMPDKEARNEIKRKLPMATISGVFEPTRKADNLKQHSGLICIDIDAADNDGLMDVEQVKAELSKLKQVAYISVSVSGRGLFAIIPLAFPTYHKRQFEQLKRDFLKIGITIDAACGDVTRMRCISYDEFPYYNPDAVPYEGYYVEPIRYERRSYGNDVTMASVSRYCELIERNHIDITASYNDWMRVAAAFASLGEEGREFFHLCSRQNADYKFSDADKKFDNLLKQVKEINIETFFYICRHEYGLKI
jgi:hypothetical protein